MSAEAWEPRPDPPDEAGFGALARRARYSRWDGSQSLPDLSAGEILDALADDVMADGDLAEALRRTTADKVIARTVPEGSDVAVTVVGLRSSDDGSASLLGDSLDDDEIELWLEIPRAVDA